MSGHTIDPAHITGLEEWSRGYLKYDNIVLDDGHPAVRSRTDMTIVKRIPLEKGVDVYTVLQGKGDGEKALEWMERATTTLAAEVSDATPEFMDVERRLLEATDAWRLAVTPGTRHAAALRVGRLGAELRLAQMALQGSASRYSILLEGPKKRDIDYKTGDDRIIPSILLLHKMRFPTDTRVLTEEDMA